MKLAIITPIPELRSFEHVDGMHLVLPQYLNDDRYLDFYLDQSKDGTYIILDNGAYEGAAIPPDALLRLAAGVLADEIVVPDKLNDMEATLKLAGEAFECWSLESRHFHLQQPQLMLVPQGSTLEEWRTCLFGLILRWQRFASPFGVTASPKATIGIPVPALTRIGVEIGEVLDRWARNLHENYDYDIHLLGGMKDLYALNRIAREFPFVRSLDTAKPIVYAMRGIVLDPLNEPLPAHTGRPADYFTRELNEHQRRIAKHNIGITRRLARGEYKDVV